MAEPGDIARLRDLVRDAAEALEAEEPVEDDEEFSIDVPMDDSTTEPVSVFVADDDEQPWVLVYSVIGNIEDLDPVDLLERNFSPGFPYIAVDEGEALVCASEPLDELDSDTLADLLANVASWSGALREEFAEEGDAEAE